MRLTKLINYNSYGIQYRLAISRRVIRVLNIYIVNFSGAD
jgi:hypothetical protein